MVGVAFIICTTRTATRVPGIENSLLRSIALCMLCRILSHDLMEVHAMTRHHDRLLFSTYITQSRSPFPNILFSSSVLTKLDNRSLSRITATMATAASSFASESWISGGGATEGSTQSAFPENQDRLSSEASTSHPQADSPPPAFPQHRTLLRRLCRSESTWKNSTSSLESTSRVCNLSLLFSTRLCTDIAEEVPILDISELIHDSLFEEDKAAGQTQGDFPTETPQSLQPTSRPSVDASIRKGSSTAPPSSTSSSALSPLLSTPSPILQGSAVVVTSGSRRCEERSDSVTMLSRRSWSLRDDVSGAARQCRHRKFRRRRRSHIGGMYTRAILPSCLLTAPMRP
ncbi:hypothetical protein B0H21DRAFT_726878 [Amylocystis lapponica]|nr:hypothetical protein B0H21DRAFT_726878 [Amylocystis lapponica]